MPTSTNKKLLDQKLWELCMPCPVSTSANTFTVNSEGPDQSIMYVTSATVALIYDPFEDAWGYLPNPAFAGTFGAGACGRYIATGPSGTATAGSATSLTTNLTLLANLAPKAGRHFKGFVTGGTGAGQYFEIESNTTGTANAVLTIRKPGVAAGLDTALDATSTYVLYTGRFVVANAGTTAAGSIKYFDYALGTWTALATTGYPATVSAEMRLVATPSQYTSFQSATATSATATTLVLSTASWTVNQWANSQVRITAGTGRGQIRSITSNTATTLTVPTWTITPDATSVFVIEGCDDYLYALGNGAVTLYRYSFTSSTWTTLSPTTARAAAPGAGASAHWIYGCTAPGWSNTNAIINGRRIYSFRGGNSAVLDYFDLALVTWVNGVTYGRSNETVNTGASWSYDGVNRLLCNINPTAGQPARIVAMDFSEYAMVPVSALVVPQGTILAGDRMSVVIYDDGVGSPQKWLYYQHHSSTMQHRLWVI